MYGIDEMKGIDELLKYSQIHELEIWELLLEDGTHELGILLKDPEEFTVALLINGRLQYVAHDEDALEETIEENNVAVYDKRTAML